MINQAFAMGAPAEGQGSGGSGLVAFLPFVLMFIILYFLLIRPQQKKQREHRQMLDHLKKGDKVVTSGGMHGTVVGLKEDIVVLRIAENVKIEFLKSAISSVIRDK